MADEETPKKKSSPMKYVIMGVAALALVGGGIGGGIMFSSMGGSAEAGDEAAPTVGDEISADAEGHGAEADSGGHGADSADDPGGGHGAATAGASRSRGSDAPVTNYSFEHPFVVNLQGGNGRYFLQVYLEVETTSPEGVDRIANNVAPVRDTIIMLCSSKTLKEVSMAEGKLRLKEEIKRRMDAIVGQGTVKQIYFVEFSTHHD